MSNLPKNFGIGPKEFNVLVILGGVLCAIALLDVLIPKAAVEAEIANQVDIERGGGMRHDATNLLVLEMNDGWSIVLEEGNYWAFEAGLSVRYYKSRILQQVVKVERLELPHNDASTNPKMLRYIQPERQFFEAKRGLYSAWAVLMIALFGVSAFFYFRLKKDPSVAEMWWLQLVLDFAGLYLILYAAIASMGFY